MADDGLLSQDEINAALAEAGMAAETPSDSGSESTAESSAADDAGTLSQADIDAAFGGGDEAPSEAATPEPDTRVDATGRPFDEVAAAMAAAIEAEQSDAGGQATAAPTVQRPAAQPLPGAKSMNIPELDQAALAAAGASIQGIDLLRDVALNVKIELGRSRMLVDDVLRLGEGSVVELDKLAGDPVDVIVNDRLVARGEVLVLNDNFCVRINDIVREQEEESEEQQ